MRVSERCAKCLYDKQEKKNPDPVYLKKVREILDNRKDTDTSPYMVYLFNKEHVKLFGKGADYSAVKKEFNDLVLSHENKIRQAIEGSDDPLATALVVSRIGNYIDLGAMNNVEEDVFLKMFDDTSMSEDDKRTYDRFLNECGKAKTFLMVCDNSGEIVLDKLLLEQIKKRFPHLDITALVRGGEVLNDATVEDAVYAGLDKVAKIETNGAALAGTVYDMMPAGARQLLDGSDVILSKGQGNYETMSDQGRHVFYMFLCKCDLFTDRFNVPRLTGMFIEEL